MAGNPKPGSSDSDELEVLAQLTEAWEKPRYDLGNPSPVEAIRFVMEQQGLNRRDLVPHLGSLSRVSEVLGGKRPLTVQMMRKLHQGLGLPATILLAEPAKPAPSDAPGKYPIPAMLKRGYFSWTGTAQAGRKKSGELLVNFLCFGKVVPAFNRQNIRMGAKEDAFALHAWRTQVLRRARDLKLGKGFSAEALDAAFLRHLAGLSVHDDGPVLAVEKLKDIGLPVIIEPHLPGTHLDGAALRLPTDGRPVIGITLRYDRLDHFWFCLFHELGHVVKHIVPGKADEVFDDLENERKDVIEKEADEFALWTLIPKTEWERIWKAKAFDVSSVRREAKRLLIDASILAGRIRREEKNYKVLHQCIGQGKVRRQFGAKQDK